MIHTAVEVEKKSESEEFSKTINAFYGKSCNILLNRIFPPGYPQKK